MARLLLIDPFSGAAGDMFLGALMGLGAPLDELRCRLESLPLAGWSLDFQPTRRAGLAAGKARVCLAALGGSEERRDSQSQVQSPASEPHRNLSEILEIIAAGDLPGPVTELACRAFSLLAEAEARVHGQTRDTIHFHEVGMTDAIIDVCGTALGLHLLGIEQIHSRPVATGCGLVSTAHGELPVPVPASLQLLQGMPLAPTSIQAELVTPTGAALLKALDVNFEEPPPLRILATAHGAGSDDRPQRPNVLRLSLAETILAFTDTPRLVVEMDFEVDDMPPEELALLRQRLPADLVLDVLVSPCLMKKGRAGQRVTILVRDGLQEVVAGLVFRHTSTFGLRLARRRRLTLERDEIEVATAWGPCPVKRGFWRGELVRVHPEADRVAQLSQNAGVPFDQVACSARNLAWSRGDA